MREHQYPTALALLTDLSEELIKSSFTHNGKHLDNIGFTLADVQLAMLKLGYYYVEIPTLPHYDNENRIPGWPNIFQLIDLYDWYPCVIVCWRQDHYDLLIWKNEYSLFDISTGLYIQGFQETDQPHFIGCVTKAQSPHLNGQHIEF